MCKNQPTLSRSGINYSVKRGWQPGSLVLVRISAVIMDPKNTSVEVG